MTAPTSAAARPKPASRIVTNEKRASHNRACTRCGGATCMAVNSSRYSLHKSSITCRVSAAMIGVIKTAWAMIMAFGVKRRPRKPSGPERDSAKKTSSPTTTGGSPIRPFSATMTASRPGKRVSATTAPRGKPTTPASSVADKVTISDRRTIANSVASPLKIRDRALCVSNGASSRNKIDVSSFCRVFFPQVK